MSNNGNKFDNCSCNCSPCNCDPCKCHVERGIFNTVVDKTKKLAGDAREKISDGIHKTKEIADDAADKAKELAGDAKNKVVEGYDKVVGNRAEDKAAREVKKAADTCASKVSEVRDKASERLHEAAHHVEGH